MICRKKKRVTPYSKLHYLLLELCCFVEEEDKNQETTKITKNLNELKLT